MKKFTDWGIDAIPMPSKLGSDDLNRRLYEINGVIYAYRMAYAYPYTLAALKQQLTPLFQALKEVDYRPRPAAKRDEIVQQGRAIMRNIIAAQKKFCWSPNDVLDIERILKYQTQKYIKFKKSDSVDFKAMYATYCDNYHIYNDLLEAAQSAGLNLSRIKKTEQDFLESQEQLRERIENLLDEHSLSA